MYPLIAFVTAVSFTVMFLIAVVVTGMRGKIGVHVPLVLATFICLAATIVFALQLGTLYDLQAAGAITTIHKVLANIATISFLAPVITGIRTLKSRENRRAHLLAALVALGLTVITLITGTLMLMRAPLL
jgi:hypothetical protein